MKHADPNGWEWPGVFDEHGEGICADPMLYYRVNAKPCNAHYVVNGVTVGYCSRAVYMYGKKKGQHRGKLTDWIRRPKNGHVIAF